MGLGMKFSDERCHAVLMRKLILAADGNERPSRRYCLFTA